MNSDFCPPDVERAVKWAANHYWNRRYDAYQLASALRNNSIATPNGLEMTPNRLRALIRAYGQRLLRDGG